MTSPASHLIGPTAAHPYPAEAEFILGFPAITSGSFYFNEFAGLIGLDTESVAARVLGDWESVARAADACRNLGRFSTTLAGETRRSCRDLDSTWDGNSATAATEYFDEFSTRLEQIGSSFWEIAGQLDQAVIGVHEAIRATGTILNLILDYAISYALVATASLIAAATGVGAPASGAIAATGATAIAYKGYKAVDKLLDVHGAAVGLCAGAIGSIATPLATVKGFNEMTVPNPYTNEVTA